MNVNRLFIAAIALALNLACGDVPPEDPAGIEVATEEARQGDLGPPPLAAPGGTGGSGGKTGNYCNGIGQSCQEMCRSAGFRKGTCQGEKGKESCRCSDFINCRTCPNWDRLPL